MNESSPHLSKSRLPVLILNLTFFAGGMTTLALELSASRLLGSSFGTSNIVWTSIIGLILIYLAVGNFAGGHLADRSPTPQRFYQLAAWAAFLSGLTPYAGRVVLPLIAGWQWSVSLAAALAVLILFVGPVVLLGTLTPFGVRLTLPGIEETGKRAGRVYAISTAGSVIGAIVPVLFFLPQFGTTATILVFAFILMLVALLGLAVTNQQAMLRLLWMPVVLGVLVVL